MIRRLLTAAVAGALLGALAGCGRSAPPESAARLTGAVHGWPAGVRAELRAVATPVDRDLLLAADAVEDDGAFALTLPDPDAAATRAAAEVYPAAPECSGARDPETRLLFLARLELTRAGAPFGTLLRSDAPPGAEGAATTSGRLWSDRAATVRWRCDWDALELDVDLELQRGWNAVALVATPRSGAGDLLVFRSDVPAELRWYRVAPGSSALRLVPDLPLPLRVLAPLLPLRSPEGTSP